MNDTNKQQLDTLISFFEESALERFYKSRGIDNTMLRSGEMKGDGIEIEIRKKVENDTCDCAFEVHSQRIPKSQWEYYILARKNESAVTTLCECGEALARCAAQRSDQVKVDALENSGTGNKVDVNFGNENSGLTFEKLGKVNLFFNEKRVPQGERFMLIAPQQNSDLLKSLIPYWKSEDLPHFSPNMIDNAMRTGIVGKPYGIKMIMITDAEKYGLPKSGKIRTCIAFTQNSLGGASDVKSSVTYNNCFNCRFYLNEGVVVLDSKSIINVDCYEPE